MLTSCIPYPRFQISGVNLGLLVFDINPSTYDVYPSTGAQTYKTVSDFDPTVEVDYSKLEMAMNWTIMPEQMWYDLEPFYRKNTDGRSEGIYFWDGAIGRFNGLQIKVGQFTADLDGGEDSINRHNVTIKIRQVS